MPSLKPHIPESHLLLWLGIDILQQGSLDFPRTCPHDLTHLLAVLEEDKGRHGPYAELVGNVGNVVNVNLVEVALFILVGELDDFRRNGFARTAPGCEAINDHERFGIDGGLEFGFSERGVSEGEFIEGIK